MTKFVDKCQELQKQKNNEYQEEIVTRIFLDSKINDRKYGSDESLFTSRTSSQP